MPDDENIQAAGTALNLVHEGWRQLQLQRPLASWACWQRALRLKPGDRAATEALDRLSGSTELPELLRKPRRLSNPANDEDRQRWDETFRGRDLADLSAALSAFEDLAEQEPTDAAAWSNRALCLAWLGRNDEAIDALDYLVHLTAQSDPDAAAESWALAETLRHGAGAEHRADDLSYSFELPWPAGAPEPFDSDEAIGAVRSIDLPADPISGESMAPGTRIVEWLDRPMPPPSDELSVDELPLVRAVVLLKPGERLRCSSMEREAIEEVERAIERRLGRGIDFDRRISPLPMAMLDAGVATFRLPEGLAPEARKRLQAEAIAHYFEERWVLLPRQGLGAGLGDDEAPSQRSPLEASRLASEGDSVLRAKLSGVILLREQLARRPKATELYLGYDFDRLRRRLGLAPLDAPPPGYTPPLQPREDDPS